MRNRRIGGEHRPRQVGLGLGGVFGAEDDLADGVEVAVMVSAREKHDVVGPGTIMMRQSEAPFASRPQIGELLRLPVDQIVRVRDQAVVDEHHELAVDAHGVVVGILHDHAIAVDARSLGEDDAVTAPVLQILRGGQEGAVERCVLLVLQSHWLQKR
jgi:hypothetical protein